MSQYRKGGSQIVGYGGLKFVKNRAVQGFCTNLNSSFILTFLADNLHFHETKTGNLELSRRP